MKTLFFSEILLFIGSSSSAGVAPDWRVSFPANLSPTSDASSQTCSPKVATGWEATAWYAGFVIVSALSMFLLAKASKSIPIGTAYPVWTGIGAVGTVLVGILVFKEPTSFWRLLFITTLIASVVGLKILS